MAEIKSTLELALERTKHLVMSEEEKKQMQAEGYLEKIPGHVQKFLDGQMELIDLVKALDAIPSEHRNQARKRFVKHLLERAGLDDCHRVLEALKVAPVSEIEAVVSDMESLCRKKSESTSQLETELRQEAEEKLRRKQISGDAVVLAPEKNGRFVELVREFTDFFEKKKQEWLRAVEA